MQKLNADDVIRDLVELASTDASRGGENLSGRDLSDGSLVGLLQAFRPDGIPSSNLLEQVTGGDEVCVRLKRLYQAVSNSQRSDSMKDAYFIVREPPKISAVEVEAWCDQFVASLAEVLRVVDRFDAPESRVLEGKAPKHPRSESEKCSLLRTLQVELPQWFDTCFTPDSVGEKLSEPFYFVACDKLLRDYLRWPLQTEFATASRQTCDREHVETLLHTYFDLWRHGIKFRVFADERVDFYIPR